MLQTLLGLLPFLLTGALAGLLSGLLGIGGGLILVPLLTLSGVSLHQAVGMSLLYILITGSSGAYQHFRLRNIRFKTAFVLALAGCLATSAGSFISHFLPPAWLAWLFVGLILGVSGLFLARLNHSPVKSAALPKGQWAIPLLIGGLAGLLSGIFGVGGGFVMTPLLSSFLPFSLEESIGTSLAAVVLIAGAGALSHLWMGDLAIAFQRWPWAMGLMGLAGALAAPWGAHLTTVLPRKYLQWALLGLMGAVGIYMFFLGFSIH
ncbi:MAG: sulfite exporter TauE/SafE family protein [Candidatus Sericytochromatia bacterium]